MALPLVSFNASFLPTFLLSLLLFLVSYPENVQAVKQTNVTMDDTDSSISYSGQWGVSAPSSLDFGGAHHLTDQAGSTATVKFTGIAVYMLSPKWPYDVSTAVQLDGGQTTVVDLVDHTKPSTSGGAETAQNTIVWSATNLQDGPHTLVLSMAGTTNYVISDGFIFTQNGPDDASSSASSAPASTPPATSAAIPAQTTSQAQSSSPTAAAATSGSKKSNTTGIAVGVTFGVLALVLAGAAFFFFRRRQQRRAAPYVGYGSTWEKDAFAAPKAPSPKASYFGGGSSGAPIAVSWHSEPPSSVRSSDPVAGFDQYASASATTSHNNAAPSGPGLGFNAEQLYGQSSTAPAVPAPPPSTYLNGPSSSGLGNPAPYGASMMQTAPAAPLPPSSYKQNYSEEIGTPNSAQSQHPYGYDNNRPASPQGTPWAEHQVRADPLRQSLFPDPHASYDPTAPNPYVGYSHHQPPMPLTQHLRPENMNTDVRQANTLSATSTTLPYASDAMDEPPAAPQQGRYMSSQEEKAALYQQHAAQDARGGAGMQNAPPAYY